MGQLSSPPDPNAPPKTAKEGPHSPQWQGLTVKEKLAYDFKHFFDFDNVAFAGIGAAFDQARDRPSQWNQWVGRFLANVMHRTLALMRSSAA